MKTSLWKKISMFVILLVMLLGFSPVALAKSAPDTITMGESGTVDGYVAGTSFGIKRLKNGGYAYCLDRVKNTPSNVKMYRQGVLDAGLAYIMKNGYPEKSITGNNQYDYYITQSAVWWYLDATTGTKNLPSNFKSGSDPHNLRKHIKSLVSGAKKAAKAGYTKPSLSLKSNSGVLTLTQDKQYYESGIVQVAGAGVSGSVNVSISGAPQNTTLVNSATGANQTTYNVGDSFKVRVPVQNVTSLSNNMTLTAQATGSVDKAYEYKAKDSKLQNVVPMVLYSVTSSLSATTKVSLSTSKLTVIKIDSATKKPLAGATIVLKDSQGKVVTSWVSTTNAHTIQNLKDGKYTLEETAAPKGYQRDKEVTAFEISSSNRDVTIYISNTKIDKSVTIQKIDEDTKKPLAGASFKITNEKGEVVTTFVTTEEAYLLKDIQDGTYYIEETQAPAGYLQNTKKYSFTISDAKPKVTITISNKKKTEVERSIQIIKIDADTQEPLAGAHIQVKDKDGNIIADFVTTEQNYVINNIQDGTYTVEEVEAPSGYNKTTEKFTFTISESTPTARVTIKNAKAEIIQEVPNTGNSSNFFMIVLGLGLILGAFGIVKYQEKRRYE